VTNRVLAIDAGNTNVVLGLFSDDRLDSEWRLATPRSATADALAVTLSGLLGLVGQSISSIQAVAIACVVPSLDSALARLSREYIGIEPLIVQPGIRTGFRLLVENPKEVGADRIVNTLAAYRRYGGPAIVIDFGTAITYDAVSAGGDFLGGAIAPGIGISVGALVQNAAKLYQVDLEAPAHAIGRSTVTNLQSGIVFGTVAQVEGMVARLRHELDGEARVIATGGQASLIAAHTRAVDHVDPGLTLEGLRLLLELNPDSGRRSGPR
jgi:type III pantothenate kinase